MPEQTYILDAIDTWFFRDGRPFSQQDDGLAQANSIFPPTPRTIAMALRAAVARGAGWDDAAPWAPGAANMPGYADDLGGYTFRGPFPLLGEHYGHNLAFAAPAHIAVDKADATCVVLLRPAHPADGRTSSLGSLSPLVSPGGRLVDAPSPFVTTNGLMACLRGNAPMATDQRAESAMVAREARAGIARSASTHIANDGQLYQAARLRPKPPDAGHKPASLCGVVSAPASASPGPLTLSPLGGDRRLAHLTASPFNLGSSLDTLSVAPSDGRYSVILLTPCPMALDAQSIAAAGLPGTLIAAALGRSRGVGGYAGISMAGSSPQHRAMLPAGSVLFMEDRTKGAGLVTLLEMARKARLAQDRYSELGYGEFVYGLWPN